MNTVRTQNDNITQYRCLITIIGDKFNFGEDAPLILGNIEEDEKTPEKMSRAERRRKRNEDKTKIRDEDDVGEFQTLESAERQKYEWWGGLSKDVDLNGLHHSSKLKLSEEKIIGINLAIWHFND